MASPLQAILTNLVETLRNTGKFRTVSLGETGTDTHVPRAWVTFEGEDEFPPDDCTNARWIRLRIRIFVHTRSTDQTDGLIRANELCEAAASALLSDPYRNQNTEDLPPGKATEIGRSEHVRNVRHPEVEIALDVRCHYPVEVQA